jgi:glutathionyl-hydroquinone reductase
MTTKKDSSLQSDIAKRKYEPDGSFKRPASVFRSFIEKGGNFEPEKGEYVIFWGC